MTSMVSDSWTLRPIVYSRREQIDRQSEKRDMLHSDVHIHSARARARGDRVRTKPIEVS
ncbi:hypothetical protein L226DRAFT_531085 [Lentinus tigrinus ALCF2SS1-7]|uniref:uncharacterized protein n=1 Tax=Lentinus tigrinus ALCF2SS1-7 TaxID=1328758 RepID=UPI00116625E4|nr:hypothetical protein L226DRAFT_531085 [Lentinus tigrinus ALCF2SS1-7]